MTLQLCFTYFYGHVTNSHMVTSLLTCLNLTTFSSFSFVGSCGALSQCTHVHEFVYLQHQARCYCHTAAAWHVGWGCARLARAGVLQCVAVFCSVLQRVAACCSMLQRVALCCRVLHCIASCRSVLQCSGCVAMCRSVLQQCDMGDEDALDLPQQVCCSGLQCVLQ